MSNDENKISDQIDGGLKAKDEDQARRDDILISICKERERQISL